MVGLERGAVIQDIDLHNIPGTSGTATCPHPSYATIPEMTKTLTLSKGDIVLLTFQANFRPETSSACYVRLKANGTVLAITFRVGDQRTSYSYPKDVEHRSFHAAYEATAAGSVTFLAEWVRYDASSGVRIMSNERHFQVIHIKN